MSTFLGSVWWMIVSLGVLVTFHEFGHYWVARRCGVKVLRFSVGFGKPLWSRRPSRHRVLHRRLPLGGYVKMLDEREGDVAASRRPRSPQPPVRRPAASRSWPPARSPTLAAVLCAAGGDVRDRAPRTSPGGWPGRRHRRTAGCSGETPAGGRDRETPTWSEAALALATRRDGRKDTAVRVRTAGDEAVRTLRLSELPAAFDQQPLHRSVGLTPRHQLLPPCRTCRTRHRRLGRAGRGDRITAIDGTPVRSFDDIGPLVQQVGARRRWSKSIATASGSRSRSRPQRAWSAQTRPSTGRWDRPRPRAVCRLRRAPATARGGSSGALRETWKLSARSMAMIGRLAPAAPRPETSPGRSPSPLCQRLAHWAGVVPELPCPAVLSLAHQNLLHPRLGRRHLLYYLIELVKGSR
jgi:regulator of sigma E protease